MLDSKKIKYTACPLPEEKLSAIEVADILKVSPFVVYKSIVVTRKGPGKPVLALVPAPAEVDLKALAAVVGEKKLVLATHDQAEELTGLQTGGISPLALLQKGFQVVMDESAFSYQDIYISGGQRGLNVHLSPQDLLKLCNARKAAII